MTLLPNGGQIDFKDQIALSPGESAFYYADGTNWYGVGLTSISGQAITVNTQPVGGNVDITLDSAEASSIIQQYTGTLTGNITVFAPALYGQYMVTNNTTGPFTLSFASVGGSNRFPIPQGTTQTFYCDATNMFASPSSMQFASGSAATPTISWIGDTDTGFYHPDIHTMAVALGGVRAANLTLAQSQFFNQIATNPGTLSAPGFTFLGGAATGFYSGTGNIDAAVTGIHVASLTPTGIAALPFGTATGNTGSVSFTELAANGTNVVTINAPDAIAADFTLTLPNALPPSTQAIVCNTSGALSYAPTPASPTAKYLVQVADGSVPSAQAMGALATGLVKNTTTTGVQSIAVAGVDYLAPGNVPSTYTATLTYAPGAADTFTSSTPKPYTLTPDANLLALLSSGGAGALTIFYGSSVNISTSPAVSFSVSFFTNIVTTPVAIETVYIGPAETWGSSSVGHCRLSDLAGAGTTTLSVQFSTTSAGTFNIASMSSPIVILYDPNA